MFWMYLLKKLGNLPKTVISCHCKEHKRLRGGAKADSEQVLQSLRHQRDGFGSLAMMKAGIFKTLFVYLDHAPAVDEDMVWC